MLENWSGPFLFRTGKQLWLIKTLPTVTGSFKNARFHLSCSRLQWWFICQMRILYCHTSIAIIVIPNIGEILYADDTLLMQNGVFAIRFLGKEYGMQLNGSKLDVRVVNSNESIVDEEGNRIEPKTKMLYLGAILNSDERIASELNRRLGIADCTFKDLQRVWNYANISRPRRFQFTMLGWCRNLYTAYRLVGSTNPKPSDSMLFTSNVYDAYWRFHTRTLVERQTMIFHGVTPIEFAIIERSTHVILSYFSTSIWSCNAHWFFSMIGIAHQSRGRSNAEEGRDSNGPLQFSSM